MSDEKDSARLTEWLVGIAQEADACVKEGRPAKLYDWLEEIRKGTETEAQAAAHLKAHPL